jgi:hypothetical protein
MSTDSGSIAESRGSPTPTPPEVECGTRIEIRCLIDRGGFFSHDFSKFEISIGGYKGTPQELDDLVYKIKERFDSWRRG